MSEQESLNLSSAVFADTPFPHFSSTSVLNYGLEREIYDWFQYTTEWSLVKTDFYEQYEFSLLSINLPDNLKFLIQESLFATIERKFSESFGVLEFELVDVVAHKLVNSQHIGVHNDFINEEETHRLVLHFNPLWKEENGGFLLLFSSSNANDISKIVSPLNNSAFGFEISRKSHHAVSKIHDFIRFTIVYTFKQI